MMGLGQHGVFSFGNDPRHLYMGLLNGYVIYDLMITYGIVRVYVCQVILVSLKNWVPQNLMVDQVLSNCRGIAFGETMAYSGHPWPF